MAKRTLLFATCSFALAALATTTSAQPPSGPSPTTAVPAEEAAISRQMDRWIASFEAGDSKSLASIFTEDGIYAANNGQVLQGRAGIRSGVQSWFNGPIGQAKATGGQLDVQRQLLRLKVSDGIAYSLMRFTIDLSPPGCVLDAGHALLVWRQQPDGAWLIDSFLGNQDKKPPPNPCRGPTQ